MEIIILHSDKLKFYLANDYGLYNSAFLNRCAMCLDAFIDILLNIMIYDY